MQAPLGGSSDLWVSPWQRSTYATERAVEKWRARFEFLGRRRARL